jgi:hypothetical protein
VSYVAEWDHPTKSGVVKKWHFDSKEAALAALHTVNPFGQEHDNAKAERKEWFICRA